MLVVERSTDGDEFRRLSWTRIRGLLWYQVAVGVGCGLLATRSLWAAAVAGVVLIAPTFYLDGGETDHGAVRFDAAGVSWRGGFSRHGRALPAELWDRRAWAEVVRLEVRASGGLWAVGRQDCWCLLAEVDARGCERLLEAVVLRRVELRFDALGVKMPVEEELWTSDFLR